MIFTDKACYDFANKKLKSIRDGFQEYLGVEIDQQPPDKVFRVYRTPQTISAIQDKMNNLPITDGHISTSDPVNSIHVKGTVSSSEIIEFFDKDLASTIAMQNSVKLSNEIIELVKGGTNQLSLGYGADLIEHDVYDFEQINIEPHHLAVVDKGRCGEICTFNDHKGELTMSKKVKLHEQFLDAEGAPNLQRIVEIAMALPEAMKTVPVNELQKMLPGLEKLLAMAKQGDESVDPEAKAEGEEAEKSGDIPDENTAEEDAEGGDPAKVADEDPAMKEKDVEDSADKAEEDKPKASPFSDQDFNDAVDKRVVARLKVIEKAREFLPATYAFGDTAMPKIMADAVATQFEDKFSDVELPTAFKLLKMNKQYENFADADGTVKPFDELKDKEL